MRGRLRDGALAAVLFLVSCVATVAGTACGGDSAGQSSAAGPLTAELGRVVAEVAGVRGIPVPEGLTVGFVGRAEAGALIEGQLTAADRETFEATTTLYRLLGILGPEEDYLSAYLAFAGDAVIGLYAPASRQFWLVGDEPGGEEALDDAELRTAAHEAVHALQDGAFGLVGLAGEASGNLDAALALSAALEGDAVVHEGLWAARYLAAPRAGVRAEPANFAAGVSAVLEREFRFPYTAGPDWVNHQLNDGGSAALDDALSDAGRLTTAEILHPGLRERGWQPVEVMLPDAATAMGDGWSRESGGTLGEFVLRNYLQTRLPALPAVTGADGWAGDRYDVYVSKAGSAAAVRVRFAGPDEAAAFAAAHRALLEATPGSVRDEDGALVAAGPGGRTTVQFAPAGDEVVFVLGSSAEAADRLRAIVRGG